ncbi:hypothetical protein NZA98_35145, partial [Escherichia coli]|nr:hypothetical protein [Escherichia coli]
GDIQAVLEALKQVAAKDHHHQISDIERLQGILDEKMPSSKAFKLDDLTDVDGADAAKIGYTLVKTETGWVGLSASAALGNHEHPISAIQGLARELAARADLVDGKVPPT